MISRNITIGLKDGLEARPVAVFVQIAGKYESQITVVYKGLRVNAKSIMGMMSLGLAKGEEITLVTEGADEDQAAEGIEAYLTTGAE
ncbi:MAG: HPr family phosphocarrier protein [Parasporobacterium sp.]|nr:HPr family phosphocarrier protein [Parasporobacterium sp.]